MNSINIWYFSISLFVALSCNADVGNGSPLEKPQILYNFDNAQVCGASFEEQCFSSPEEYGFYIGAKTERQLLQTVEIDNKTEREIGEEFHKSSGFAYIEDNRTQKLRDILTKMKPYVNRKDVAYQVYLIQDPAINAWTVPGGRIYFTTGIYAFAESDHELANIMGHEIGHNECKHTHKILQRRAIAQMPLQFFGFDIDADFFVGLYSSAVVAFGQHEEMEADRNGFHLAAKTGYDPKIGLEFWNRLAKNEQKSVLENLFRSHPYSIARYQCGQDYIENHRINKK